MLLLIHGALSMEEAQRELPDMEAPVQSPRTSLPFDEAAALGETGTLNRVNPGKVHLTCQLRWFYIVFCLTRTDRFAKSILQESIFRNTTGHTLLLWKDECV